jgi:hypothetical protein
MNDDPRDFVLGKFTADPVPLSGYVRTEEPGGVVKFSRRLSNAEADRFFDAATAACREVAK